MNVAVLRAMTTTEIAALTTTQIPTLTNAEVAALNTTQYAAMSTVQTAALTSAQLAVLSPWRGTALNTTVISTLAVSAAGQLTLEDVAASVLVNKDTSPRMVST